MTIPDGTFRMIVLLHPLKDASCISKEYFSEHLSVMLPKNHRLAKHKSLALKDLADETFVMYDDIGFWDKVKREKIPGAKFIRIERRDENDSLTQIIGATDMPSFISDRTTQFSLPENRIAVPLSDPEMNVTFWCVFKKDKSFVYGGFLRNRNKRLAPAPENIRHFLHEYLFFHILLHIYARNADGGLI